MSAEPKTGGEELTESLDPELRETLERFGRAVAEREQQEQKTQPERKSAKVIQLPLWPEPVRGLPNPVLRAALFAAIQGKDRRFINGETLAAVQGVTIRFKGEQLNQEDLYAEHTKIWISSGEGKEVPRGPFIAKLLEEVHGVPLDRLIIAIDRCTEIRQCFMPVMMTDLLF